MAGFYAARGGTIPALPWPSFAPPLSSGVLQVDGYSAYTNLAKTRAKTGSNETIQLAGCWAHLRRKFYDLHISGVSQAATDSIIAMTELWQIEDEVRGKDAGSRAELRQEECAAIVSSLFDLCEKELGKVSGKSKTAEAIRYALNRREALERFLTDGRIEIDSNIVERAIRPRRERGWWTDLGHAGHLAANLQNEWRRSARLVLPNLDTHRSKLASIRNRSAHALELQA